MARLTHLDDVLFPVEECAVFAIFAKDSMNRRISVPDKKALVNANTRRVLSVVSRGYRLVTNREALDMALKCCRILFPETHPGEWEVKATDAPSTGGHCYIDLAHNSTALDFSFVPPGERPESYGPFVRVTNSYNGLRALTFDIGFYRKVCKNGLVLPDSVVRFSFVHRRRDIGENIQFDISNDRLAKMKAGFLEFLSSLRDYQVPTEDLQPLVLAVLALHPPKTLEPDTREAIDWTTLITHIAELQSRYTAELGTSAYTVLNVVTEFASDPPANAHVHRDRHSLQRLAGAWLNTFCRQCHQPGFNLKKHLVELTKPKTQYERA